MGDGVAQGFGVGCNWLGGLNQWLRESRPPQISASLGLGGDSLIDSRNGNSLRLVRVKETFLFDRA